MKNDRLKQFVSLRDQLLRDKAELEARLSEINKALGAVSASVEATAEAPRRGRKPGRKPGVKPGRKPGVKPGRKPGPKPAGGAPKMRGNRAGNAISLSDAVKQVTKEKPLSRQEILEAVQAIGYKFKAKDPLNSLSTLLYTDKTIKNHGGKFGPA